MKVWQITGLACLLAAQFAGCAHSGDSQVLQYRGAIEALRAGDQCLATDITRVIQHATLDLAITKNYRFFPALQSMMQATNTIIGINPSTKDTNTITLSSMTVTVNSGMVTGTPFVTYPGTATNSPAKGPPPTTWTVPMNGSVQALQLLITAADLIPEKALIGSKLIPIGEDWRSRFYAAAMKKEFPKTEIELGFQFTGTTLSGDSVITDTATMPLTICYGCLLYPVTASAVGSGGDYYAGCGTAAVPTDFVSPCLPGQEDPLDCRYYCHACQKFSTPKYESCVPQLCTL